MYDNEMTRHFVENGIPFNVFLGMQVEEARDGMALMRVPTRPELTGDPFRPALHGGVISALADTVAGLAVFTLIQKGQTASTLDLRVDYLRPGNVDEDVHARAEVVRMGSRVAVTQTSVYQADIEAPIATATAVYNVVNLQNFDEHTAVTDDD